MRILFVDDHEDTRYVVSRFLARHGHQVTPAGTAHEARRLCLQYDFDLLVCDAGLPDGCGIELARELIEEYRLTAIGVSGRSAPEDLERGRAAGLRDYLTKPVTMEKLLRAVQDHPLART